MEMAEPSHGEILRAIGALEATIKQLVDNSKADNTERSSLGVRVGKLETGMAQVKIIAIVAALITPILWSEVKNIYAQLSQPQTQQPFAPGRGSR